VANTNTDPAHGQSADLIADGVLSGVGAAFTILYINKAQDSWTAPRPARETGAVTVHQVNGPIGGGPLHVIRVTLQPVEVQVLGRRAAGRTGVGGTEPWVRTTQVYHPGAPS